MPPTMRALVCRGPRQLAVEERAVPEPGPGEVRIRVRAAGICGSDLHLLPFGYLGQPVVPGHETAGVVDALGSGVRSVRSGDLVAVEPLDCCGDCASCRSGWHALCRKGAVYGVHRDGGLAEYLTVPAHRLFPLPPDLAPEVAAMAEPLAVIVHGLRRGGFEKGRRVLVLGAGSLGLMSVVAARALGASEVFVTARYDPQAALAAELGADRVLREQEADREALHRLGAEGGFETVMETVGGHADTLDLGAAALAPRGTISVVGVFLGPVSLEPYTLFAREATLAWSNCYEHGHDAVDFDVAVGLLDEHRESLARLSSHRIPLERAPEAFALASDKTSGAIKVTILG